MAERGAPPATGEALFQRVIVDLAGARGSEGLIEAAAQFARMLRLELHGLYVREEALRDFAGLPFAATLEPGRRRPVPVNPEDIEKGWQAEETLSRRRLVRAALRCDLVCDFESASGQLEGCLAAIVTAADVIALSPAAGDLFTREGMAMLRRTVQLAGAVLLGAAGQHARAGGPVLLIEAGGDETARPRRLAETIAAVAGRKLIVLPAAEVRAAHGIEDTMLAAIRRVAPALVIASPEELIAGDDRRARLLLTRLPTPALIVGRRPRAGV